MDREAKLALAKRKLQEFQAKKAVESPSTVSTAEICNESSPNNDAAVNDLPDVIEQKAEDSWIDNWVQKVNALKRTEKAATSVSLKPILTAIGVSTNVVDTLDFSSAIDTNASPVKVEEIQLPVIPEVESTDPGEYQIALLNKIKILEESLEKLRTTYVEEISRRKIMENSVAQITSSIVTGLTKLEEEKSRTKQLLDDSLSEKNKLKAQIQELIKKNQELTEELYIKQTQTPSEEKKSDLELKLQELTQDLFAAQKTSKGLQHTLEVKQAEWIRKEKDIEDSMRSIEMEKASLAVLKAQIENMKFSAEDELQKALNLKVSLEKSQNDLEKEKKELDEKTKYLGDAQRILNQRVDQKEQMSQSKDINLQKQLSEEKEFLEKMREALNVEKEKVMKDRIALNEKENLFMNLEEKENSISKKLASLISKERDLNEKESDFREREKLILEKENLILRQMQENETNKASTSTKMMEEEFRLRQEELSKSIRSFNEFKEQLEASMKERESKYHQKLTLLENEKNEAIKKFADEKEIMEAKIRKLEEQIIFSPKKSIPILSPVEKGQNGEYQTIVTEELEAIEQEKSIISEIKTKTEQESAFVKSEKARILEEANLLEREWMAVRLKEAEITKAMADISVAAAQQAVGSSITTAETLISRDQMRELEYQNRELMKENESLKIKISGKEKVGPSAVSPLFKSTSFSGNGKLSSPILNDLSPELGQVIFNLTQSNEDIKSRIEQLVKTFEKQQTPIPATPLPTVDESQYESQRPSSRSTDTYARKARKPIADPRMIQSALDNPIAFSLPTSPDPSVSIYSRPRIIPSLKSSPPRPASTELRRAETSLSNYSVPSERPDIVKVLDAQISAKMNELNEIMEATSPQKKSHKKKPSSLSENERERIRELIKERIKEKKTSATS